MSGLSATLMARWALCQRCGLSAFRRKVVFGRGRVPAEVLMIGEAPGKSENLTGDAFVGPAGVLLDKALAAVARRLRVFADDLSFYVSNTVACRPTDDKHGSNREPTDEEMMACWPRLLATEQAVAPSTIVLMGKVAVRHCLPRFPHAVEALHPSFVKRRGGVESTEFRRLVRTLVEVFRPQVERAAVVQRRVRP